MFKQMKYTAMAMAFALSPLSIQTVYADASVADPAILTFSTVGDSRQDVNPAKKADPSQLIFKDADGKPIAPQQDAIWHQSTKAWSRIISEIEDQNSDFLFFNGDMIMGYGNAVVPADTSTVESIVSSDLVREYKEYAFWRGMVAGMMEKGTYVVPVPGNHEVQCSSKVNSTCSGKAAHIANENAWRANMGDLILDNPRLAYMFGSAPSYENVGNNGPDDGLTTDQSQLSYSFDIKNTHFVVINTDPVGDDAHAPTEWLKKDLAAAQGRGMQHMFVFGHKPAFTYYFGADVANPDHPAGLGNYPAARDAFWAVIEQYGATYFCGHEHIYHMDKHGSAWQVLVGSGGSPFEAAPTDTTINPATDRDYAWATVKVLRNGKVNVTIYGFDENFGSTKILQSETF